MVTILRIRLLLFVLASCGCASSGRGDAPGTRTGFRSPLAPSFGDELPGRRSGGAASSRFIARGWFEDYSLILKTGDEVATALADFARSESVAAQFAAVGAVRDPDLAWFDPSLHRYKATRFVGEQAEVLSLLGDSGLNEKGDPLVHAHGVFGRSDGSTFGGNLVGAATAPTLEVFVTTFAHPLRKRLDPATDLELFDLASLDP